MIFSRFPSWWPGAAPDDNTMPPDESGRIAPHRRWLRLAAATGGGIVFALALPPVNAGILVVAALTILTLAAGDRRAPEAALCGWCWGVGWALPAFWWLREIHPVIPFLMAPVLALWPAVWALFLPLVRREFLIPPAVRLKGEAAEQAWRVPDWRLLLAAAGMAGWWIVLEYSRSTMLPWNNLSTAVWRYERLLPLAAYAGQYGIGFLLALTGVALAFGIRFRNERGRIRAVPVLAAVALTWLLAELAVAGRAAANTAQPDRLVRIGVVQGDISQRRNADGSQAQEALDTYLALSAQLAALPEKPELILWPETAVPYPLKADHPVSAAYRRGIAGLLPPGAPYAMLIGTIDFAPQPGGASKYGVTNSALLLQPGPVEAGRFDKIHRVPFGEYIPFRRFLPEWLTRAIDMNRDLTPGGDYSPLPVVPGVRAGVAICFESVFPYIAREEARRGANLLIVLSNDAWYPTSAEPEQHLANAVLRSVETGLPAIRCGNNGGTLVIRPDGRIAAVLPTPGTERPEIRRGRATGILEVPVTAEPELTFYTRHGDWAVVLAGLGAAALFAAAAGNWLRRKRILAAMHAGDPSLSATNSRPGERSDDHA